MQDFLQKAWNYVFGAETCKQKGSALCHFLFTGSEIKILAHSSMAINDLQVAGKKKATLTGFCLAFEKTLKVIQRSRICCCIPFPGRVPLLLLSFKLLNILVCSGHFLLLNILVTRKPDQIFSGDYHELLWAINILLGKSDPIHFFPRVSLCDVDVRALGYDRVFTVQCSLNVNFLNEKVFLFLWFYNAMLVVLSCSSFILFFLSTFTPGYSFFTIKSYLQAGGIKPSSRQVYKFVQKLGCDGFCLLRCIRNSTSETTTVQIICQLWSDYASGESLKYVLPTHAVHSKTL